MRARRVAAWLLSLVTLLAWAFVAWEHWVYARGGWHGVGLPLVLLGPALVFYCAALVRSASQGVRPDGVGEYTSAPPLTWAPVAVLLPSAMDWFERPVGGRSVGSLMLQGVRGVALAVLILLVAYLLALLRTRYRLTPSELEVVADGKVVLAVRRELIIHIPGIGGNAAAAEAERSGLGPGLVPLDSPGVPFGGGARIYYRRNGQPRALGINMTPELREALILWMLAGHGNSGPTGGR